VTDQELMAAIKAKYGSFIDEAIEGTPFPAALVAALVANESGLNEGATRFEPKVAGALILLATGVKANYGSIGAQDLLDWLGQISMDTANGGRLPPQAAVLLALRNLASSWGPTQIMGYQALAGHYALSELPNLQWHFKHCVAMLDDFKKRFSLATDAAADFSPYFHCWNAGAPGADTFDPNYTANGLRRMAIYEAL